MHALTVYADGSNNTFVDLKLNSTTPPNSSVWQWQNATNAAVANLHSLTNISGTVIDTNGTFSVGNVLTFFATARYGQATDASQIQPDHICLEMLVNKTLAMQEVCGFFNDLGNGTILFQKLYSGLKYNNTNSFTTEHPLTWPPVLSLPDALYAVNQVNPSAKVSAAEAYIITPGSNPPTPYWLITTSSTAAVSSDTHILSLPYYYFVNMNTKKVAQSPQKELLLD